MTARHCHDSLPPRPWKRTRRGFVLCERPSTRKLCAGVDPRNGKGLVRAAGPGHRAGWDFTFSAPKSVSILWMSADEERRSLIVAVHRAAVGRALQLFESEQLLEARLGQGGYFRERPVDIIVGRFAHYTSREGDCNLHEHCVLLNVLGCSDKKWRTAETQRAFTNLTLLGAAYRAELASGLRQLGFQLREAGRGQFEVAGLPTQLLEQFSKRSQQIEAEVGRGASTLQKAVATLRTRRSKVDVPVGEALEERWRNELAEIGIDPWQDALTYKVSAAQEPEVEFEMDQPPIHIAGPVSAAAAQLFEHQSVLTRNELLRTSLIKAPFQSKNVDETFAELKRLENDGSLLKLQDSEVASHWTSPIIARREASLLRNADRLEERDWFQSEALAHALDEAVHLSTEQKEAIRFSCNRDGVAICEAASGTGKTTIAQVIVDAARRSGLSVRGLAPTWTAADELSKSTGISSFAIAKWRYDNRTPAGPSLNPNTLLILDEASMCGSADLEEVLRLAKTNQSKIIFLGDRRQLEAVAGGNPLKAISEITLKSATLTQVRRQHVAWQRAASIVMAHGDVESGLRAYARNQRIEFASGERQLLERTIERWTNLRTQKGEDVLLITRRNADAKRLNDAARIILFNEGKLVGKPINVRCIDRDKKLTTLELAAGDRIRFGENIPDLGIRNGTRGTVEMIASQAADPVVRIRLDSGNFFEGPWSTLARERFGKRSPPKIGFAYAGTAYSVQGRTSAASVLMISTATDARELYVGLTRHQKDAYVVAEARPATQIVARRCSRCNSCA
ncbi:MAG: relaxase domain-containing protein [Hyphomicrobiales bacterium]|nr:relaxase domain-containing protein [Hyphomicrobiales bacterium]